MTGLLLASLGFTVSVPGSDVTAEETSVAPVANGTVLASPTAGAHRNYSGVWLSRYEYHSSGRDGVFTGWHYVVVLQHGDRLTVRSLPGGSSNPDSPLTMDLTVDGNVITGTWVEQTATEGYYRGARYHGSIQMLAEPNRRMLANGTFDVNFETLDPAEEWLGRRRVLKTFQGDLQGSSWAQMLAFGHR